MICFIVYVRIDLIAFVHIVHISLLLFFFLTAISNIIKALSNQTLSSGARRSAPTCWKGVYYVL